MEPKLKVAFTGPSGSGKTTLVKFVEKEFGIPHLNGSSGELLNAEDTEQLRREFGFIGGKGHAHVIMHSHMDSKFGLTHQNMVLERRIELFRSSPEFVTDRSPLDNFVYFVLQTGLYWDNATVQEFKEECRKGMQELTHLIFISGTLPQVEDNNSRVAIRDYQRAVSAVFQEFFGEISGWDFDSDNWVPIGVKGNTLAVRKKNKNFLKILLLEQMDLGERKEIVKDFLNSPTIKN